MKEKIKELYNKDNNIAYKALLELETSVIESNDLYNYFDSFLSMLKSNKSFIRKRGFRLICHLSVWDIDNKINNNINDILSVFDTDNGIVIRQCLSKINLLLLYKPELSNIIETKLKKINISLYKESLQPLITKDINAILESL